VPTRPVTFMATTGQPRSCLPCRHCVRAIPQACFHLAARALGHFRSGGSTSRWGGLSCVERRRLTLPSSGRLPAGFARFQPPLMSNVRALRMQVNSLLKYVTAFVGAACAACLRIVFQPLPRSAQFSAGVPAGSSSAGHSLSWSRSATFVVASPPRHGVRSRGGCLAGHTSVSLTRALRAGVLRRAVSSFSRSAASPVLSCTITPRQSEGTVLSVIASSKTVAFREQRPNPSIERTYNSGRRWSASARSATLLSAAHVKR